MGQYVLTSNGGFYSTGELYHYGVPGMKWGHRKKQIRDGKADRRIGQTEVNRSANKMMLDARNRMAEAKYYGGRAKVKNTRINQYLDKQDAKMLATAKARNQVTYDISEMSDKYAIARQKAKKDKNYKKTSEYKSARNDLGKSYLERAVFGNDGYLRIHTDMNKGMSRKKAVGKEAVVRFLNGTTG